MLKVDFEQQVPVIKSVDLLIIGATLPGAAVAEQAASQGINTLLIEPKTYCAAELGAWHRPWIYWKASQEKLVREWFPDIASHPVENEPLVFVPDRLKTQIETVLIKSGCDVLYGCLPVACYKSDEGYLLMIGNRSGMQLIKTKRLIDASENSLLSAVSEKITLTDAFLIPDQDEDSAHVSLELVDAEFDFIFNQKDQRDNPNRLSAATDQLADAERLTIQKNKSTDQLTDQLLSLTIKQADVTLIQSAFAPGNVILDIKMRSAADDQTSGKSGLEYQHRDEREKKTPLKAGEARRDTLSDFELCNKAFEVTKQLMEEHPAFRHASVGLAAERPMRLSAYDPVVMMAAGIESFHRQEQQMSSYCIRFFKPCSFGSDNPGTVRHDHLAASQLDDIQGSVTFTSRNDFNRYYQFETHDVPAFTLPAAKTDVLVVGGGTAGSVAAYAAASEQADVILTEMNSVLGGTGTIGGVHSYWFGLTQGFTRMVDQQMDQLENRLRQQRKSFAWETGRSWNPSIKAFALHNWLREQSVPILFNSICVGVIKEQNQIKGAFFATEQGPLLIQADFTIDATGDGDLACFAGADYTYGSQNDRFTMWSSLAQYSQAGQYRGGVFTTNVDIGDVFDCTRYLLVNRRRGPENCFDHGTYLTTRESRHIQGDYTVSFKDVLMMKTYPDTVAVGFSNFDPKGKSDQDEVYVGVVPSQQRFALPLRAFIPSGLEGLLVTGKAISATHDALPIIRMQSDVQEQGGACGLAAAWCVRQNLSIRDLDMLAFQKRLAAIGSLPDSYLVTEHHNMKTDEELFDWADVIRQAAVNTEWTQTDLDPGYVLDDPLPVWKILNASSSDVLPPLIKAYEAASDKSAKLNYARLLTWHQNDAGASFLADYLNQALDSQSGLPVRKGSLQWSQLYPDQGIMTELTYDLNLLSRTDHPAVVPIVHELVERIVTAERDYHNEQTCLFSLIDTIARIAEAKQRPELIPALKQLQRLPEIFSEKVTCKDDFDLDLVRERLAMLKLLLARALASYHQSFGFEVLEDLTQDRRLIIAKSAADCLYRFSAKRVFLPQPV